MRNLQKFLAVLMLVLLGTATPALGNEIQGTIAWICPDDHTFTLVDDRNNVLEMRLVLTGEVFADGDEATIWDLQPGQRVAVTYTAEDGELQATQISEN